MSVFNSLTKGVKGFFLEEDAPGTPVSPAGPGARPAAPAPPLTGLAPGVSQPEQRHLDHLAQLLAGDGRDFGAFTKMVRSLAASGLGGPLLYQTAFNAFAAVTGQDLPGLLTSADQLTQKLTDDRARVQERHREKMGDAGPLPGAPGPVAELRRQEARLQADVAALTEQLGAATRQLEEAQQQLHQERTRAQAALASYELAHAASTAELQAHQQATRTFLLATQPS